MNLSISNIGWSPAQDKTVYALMREFGYSGLEIAPTRIFPEAPYDKIEDAGVWAENLKNQYGFRITSMQSIWYGRQEMIFGTAAERNILMEYTKKAIDFAAKIGCGNLVFGCPRNRNIPEGADSEVAVEFFREIGEYAEVCGTVIGMEANPGIYHTNYINDTLSALNLVRQVDCGGFLLNLDVGTMIYNREKTNILLGNEHLINHVHISEPYLAQIQSRQIHKDVLSLLAEAKYRGYISIEMGKQAETETIARVIKYLADLVN